MNNGSSGEAQPSFEAPAPVNENTGETSSGQSHEQAALQESKVGRQQPQQSLPAQQIVLPAVTDDSQVQLPTDDDTHAKTGSNHGTENHISEKQWIDKAKAIVAENREDPFVQGKQMSDFKAQYIQKRFNKTIPRDDAVAA